MCIQESGPGLQSPAVVLSKQSPPGSGGVVSGCCLGILQWGELLLPRHFKGNKVPGEERGQSLHVLAMAWPGLQGLNGGLSLQRDPIGTVESLLLRHQEASNPPFSLLPKGYALAESNPWAPQAGSRQSDSARTPGSLRGVT